MVLMISFIEGVAFVCLAVALAHRDICRNWCSHGGSITSPLKWSLISTRVILFPSKSVSLPVPSVLARARSPHGHVDITFAGCIVAGEHGIGGRVRFAEPTE